MQIARIDPFPRKWFFMILVGAVLGLLAWFVRECLSLVMTTKTRLVEDISRGTKGLPPALGQAPPHPSSDMVLAITPQGWGTPPNAGGGGCGCGCGCGCQGPGTRWAVHGRSPGRGAGTGAGKPKELDRPRGPRCAESLECTPLG